MIQFILLILLFALTSVTVDVSTAMLIVFAYFVGKGLSFSLGGTQKKEVFNIYGLLYLIGWAYMLLCYWYMIKHGYNWLLAFDTYDSFIPITEKYINLGNGNIWKIYELIFEDYDFFSRQEYFYWAYSCTWGVVIKLIGCSLYLGLQTSTLFLFGFVGVVLYKLFLSYGFDKINGYKYTLIICFCSIVFFYSSQILRDIHVLLFYLMAFYLCSKSRFSLLVLIELLLVIFITCGLRIESGLFLFLTIPAYLLLSVQNRKYRIYSVLGSILAIGVFSALIILNFQTLFTIFENNSEAYVEYVSGGAGLMALFQRIPVLGDFISILYNASQPIPVWSRLDPMRNLQYGGNASNIMNFTRIPAAYLNIMTYTYCSIWLFNGNLRQRIKTQILKAHKYQLWIGLLFLYLQSAVVSQRRLMGYYCIYYLLMFVIYDNLSDKERKSFNGITIALFSLLQIIGIIYFI